MKDQFLTFVSAVSLSCASFASAEITDSLFSVQLRTESRGGLADESLLSNSWKGSEGVSPLGLRTAIYNGETLVAYSDAAPMLVDDQRFLSVLAMGLSAGASSSGGPTAGGVDALEFSDTSTFTRARFECHLPRGGRLVVRGGGRSDRSAGNGRRAEGTVVAVAYNERGGIVAQAMSSSAGTWALELSAEVAPGKYTVAIECRADVLAEWSGEARAGLQSEWKVWSLLGEEPVCDGDADGNGFVDFSDIYEVLNNLGNDYGGIPALGDADRNGVVNFDDVAMVARRLNAPCS